jgi:hypothetical protein
LGREIGPKAADRVQGDGSERRRKSMPGTSGPQSFSLSPLLDRIRDEFHLSSIVHNLKTTALHLLGPPTGQVCASIA